jgi:hypothetical protein
MSRFHSFRTPATRPHAPAIQAPESILIDLVKVLSRQGSDSPPDEDLIDWHTATDDLIYLLIFSQQNILATAHVPSLADLLSPGDSRAAPYSTRPCAAPGRTDHDELRGRPLITSWMSATGRTFRANVSPRMLTEKDLITFWADQQITTRYVMATRPTSREDAR